MSYKVYEYGEYVVRFDKRGRAVSVRCVKQTADYYGWSAAFPEYTKSHNPFFDRPSSEVTGLRRRSVHKGGTRHLICRDRSRRSNPAGKTNCFRTVGEFTNRDLAQLAVVAGDKFEWMEGFHGARIFREDWLKLAS